MSESVEALLQRSRQAHLLYHQLSRHFDGHTWHVGDLNAAHAQLQIALDARLDAERADPTFDSPEWDNDKAPHAEIVAWMTQHLADHQ